MQQGDTMLLAALADAEVLRHDLQHSEELFQAERRRADDLLDAARGHADDLIARIDALERRAVTSEERQRELHVLLLHRDEEISRLHEYLRSSGAAAPGTALALPEPPPRRPATVEQRVVAKLTADATHAAGWLSRVLARSQKRAAQDE